MKYAGKLEDSRTIARNINDAVLLLTDIDGSIIFSCKKQDVRRDLVIVGKSKNNVQVMSFKSFAALSMLRSDYRKSRVIYATARSREQYERLSIPKQDICICENGCLILSNGEEDREWRSFIKKETIKRKDELKIILDIIYRHCKHFIVPPNEKRLNVHFKAKLSEEKAKCMVAEMVNALSHKASEWDISYNLLTMKMDAIPSSTSKGAAALFLVEKKQILASYHQEQIFSCGDSALDLSLMRVSSKHYTCNGGGASLFSGSNSIKANEVIHLSKKTISAINKKSIFTYDGFEGIDNLMHEFFAMFS